MGTTGLKAFDYLQVSAPETVPGTAQAAVEILYSTDVSAMTHANVWFMPEQDRNNLALHVEAPILVSKEATLTLEGELYDRIAIWLFANAIRGNVTPTQPDNINQPLAYEWLFEPSLSGTGNTPDCTDGIDTFTFEFGDNIQDYEADFAFTASIEITGAPGEPVTFSVDIQVQDVAETTRTAALVEPARKAYFAFNNTQIFIDSTWANLGTTAIDDMLTAFTYTFETGFTARYTASGDLAFSGLNEARKAPELELTYRRDSVNSETEKDKFLANTLTFIRIAMFSDGEMDVGESNPEYIYLDTAVRYSEWPEYEEDDGINVITPATMAHYDATSAKMMSVTVGTTLSAYPS